MRAGGQALVSKVENTNEARGQSAPEAGSTIHQGDVPGSAFSHGGEAWLQAGCGRSTAAWRTTDNPGLPTSYTKRPFIQSGLRVTLSNHPRPGSELQRTEKFSPLDSSLRRLH